MSVKILQLKESFLNKQLQLEVARKTLKNEFFGIDKAIDELINNTRSWYVLNTYQTRPLVVNLWGLTGVGKTSLITRLAELLSCDDRLYKFDLGVSSGSSSFYYNIEDISKKGEAESLILMLDEFQHSRTLAGPFRMEIGSDKNRQVWELLDSGKIEYYNCGRELSRIGDYVKKLAFYIENGVSVKNGVVTKGWRWFSNDLESRNSYYRDDEKIDKSFIDKEYYDAIIEYAESPYKFTVASELKDYLYTLNGRESVDFLMDLIKKASRPQIKNFTKSLIFVIGNLDEAYSMHDNLSTDIDADTFYEASLKITLPQIKRALTQRFRNEQVARLGNTHIIYPALSKNAYENIILNELEKLKAQTLSHLDLELQFDNSVVQLIYKEGVFPTQGVRPLLTTINNLLKTNLPIYFSEILLHDLNAVQLKFTVINNRLICYYVSNETIIHEKTMNIATPLEDIRISKKDDMQAITAVHESGHALISALLLKVIPDHVYSITTEIDASGFIFSKFPWKYVARQDVIKRVAMYLGGYVAEELVFGNDHVTTGSSRDIRCATEFLSRMFKEEGLGALPLYYNLDPSDNNAIHDVEAAELGIQETMKKGYALAKETLEKEMPLLLVLSDYLSDHSSIEKEVLKQKIQDHKTSEVEFMDTNDHIYYRSHLKKMILENQNKPFVAFERVCLNRNKNGSIKI